MSGHEAIWEQQPAKDGCVGQYYCAKCKLTLQIWYNQNRVSEACTGWIWEIVNDSGTVVDSAGGKYARRYEFDSEALEEVKKAGLMRFDSVSCRRSN